MHTTALRDVADRCRGRLSKIAEEYAQEVRRLPGYAVATVTDDELSRTAREVLDLLMRMLAGDDVRGTLSAVSERVGRHRAQQGLALDSLLRAVRMDFRFLWEVLRDEADADEVLALSEEVATVWEAVEVHTSHIQAAYIDELVSMNRQLELERASLLRRLLVGETSDPTQLAHLASALGLPVLGRYRVLVAAPRFADAFRRWAKEHVAGADLHVIDGTQFLIVERSGPRTPPEARLQSAPAGLSPTIDGLAGLGVGWQIARRLADEVTEPQNAATLLTHWPMLVEEGLGEAWPIARRELTSRLDALSAGKRSAIVDTVRAYQSSGSIGDTASRLFVHRNTLLKRLQRFTELTGLDPTVPSDAALITLILARP
ncbi:hypothetical protein A4X17_12425 [Plantibacter sp. H53]|uniref:PucR family transcriptional regulator n=1 Tax=unclassified Plantibacter TaxID=2624265 RepID=UPI0007F4D516|nr:MULTISPECIES: PucR family transcriptional regulator [unclassified Plantibacter]MBD8467666.1 helix-turn-helix domain-containing protein [Plantibacter sp. CFBP 8798]OAN34697.1 hypothetical protein A4X17_12425 [Plantibacter sp. H53]